MFDDDKTVVHTGPVGRYKKHLLQAEIETTERYLANQMRAFGYDLVAYAGEAREISVCQRLVNLFYSKCPSVVKLFGL